MYPRLLSYVRPYAKVFALALLGMMLAAATEPALPALMKPLLDSGFGRATFGCAVPTVILGFSWCAAVFTQLSYFARLGGNQGVLTCASRCSNAADAFADAFLPPFGQNLTNMAYDVHGASMRRLAADLIRDSMPCSALLGWLLYLNWKLTLFALAVVPADRLAVRIISRRLRAHHAAAQQPLGELAHVLEETIECRAWCKVFGGRGVRRRRAFASAAKRAAPASNEASGRRRVATPPITHVLAALALSP